MTMRRRTLEHGCGQVFSISGDSFMNIVVAIRICSVTAIDLAIAITDRIYTHPV